MTETTNSTDYNNTLANPNTQIQKQTAKQPLRRADEWVKLIAITFILRLRQAMLIRGIE